MEFDRENEMELWFSLVDIFGDKNLICKCIPNIYFAFAVRKNNKWKLHEIVGKGGKVVKCKSAYSGYKIEYGGALCQEN